MCFYESQRYQEITVGVYLIYGVKTITKTTFSLKLESLAYPLRNKDSAEGVKNGTDFYSNRPVSFLISKLLALRYGNTQMEVPSGYDIPDRIQISTATYLNGDSGDQRGLSTFGQLPDKDNNGNWHSDGLVTRAMLFSYSTLGSINPFGDSDVLYYGADNQLWKWNPSTEESTKLGEIDSTYNIHKIYYNVNDYKLYLVAWQDAESIRNQSMRIYSYDGSSLTQINSAGATSLGRLYREGVFDVSNLNRSAGQTLAGENFVIPFKQYVRVAANDSVFIAEASSLFNPAAIDPTVKSFEGTVAAFLNSGYYATYAVNSGSTPTGGLNLRFTFGQEPFVAFVKEYGSLGGIILSVYAWINGQYALYIYDISSGSASVLPAPL